MPSILIVCTANICRSPMAEAILKHLVAARQDASEWHIESAGTWANIGSQPAPGSQFVMQTMGIDISSHQSKPVTMELLQKFDVILTMESMHKRMLQELFKDIASRVHMLSEMVGELEDVADPIGGELTDYQATANQLARFLSDGLERINQIALNPLE